MSNEERLDDIKAFTGPLVDRYGKDIGFDITGDELQFLYQQAEHAQHLERKYENTGSMFGRQAQRTLIDENNRMRKALDFIAAKSEVSEGYEYADQVANSLINTAKKALEDNQ